MAFSWWLATVNRSLGRDNDAGMFVTAVAGVLDLASGELSFPVAGHEPPVLVPADGAPLPRPAGLRPSGQASGAFSASFARACRTVSRSSGSGSSLQASSCGSSERRPWAPMA